MAEDWRSRGEQQTVKVEAPEKSASPVADTTTDLARDGSRQPKAIDFESRRDVSAKPRSHRIAVLSIHGMGQQIPFETVDQVQRNLCAAASRRGVELPRPTVRVAKVGDEVLRRAEIHRDESADSPGAHFYEAYWAPLTEGRVGLRDVISFLRMGGSNGLRHSLSLTPSWRFMFEKRFPFPRSVTNSLSLLLALLAVSSLVALNAIILGVAAATNWLPAPPAWLTEARALQDDLTGVASLVCLVGAAFGACLVLAMARRDLARTPFWRLSAPQRSALNLLFYSTLLTLIACAGTMIWLVKQHTGAPAGTDASILNALLGGDSQALQLAAVTTAATALIVLIAVAGLLVKLILGQKAQPLARLVVIGLFYAIVAVLTATGGYLAALLLGMSLPSFSPSGLPAPLAWLFENRRLWVWTALIALSGLARSFLVQYVGDVAVYVSPHKLDRFNEIREKIRGEVFKTACALYAARSADGTPEYDQVALVGHSLGSVVAYDTLNFLINKDLLSDAPMGVNERTCLLLTFGSPLDKIAYIFQTQGTRTSDTREALANAVQPLIRSYEYRNFKWINVYSKDDIISGSLELFDDGSGDPRSVHNLEDPFASIPLVAHTEYWQTPVVWDILYNHLRDHLIGDAPSIEDFQREAS